MLATLYIEVNLHRPIHRWRILHRWLEFTVGRSLHLLFLTSWSYPKLHRHSDHDLETTSTMAQASKVGGIISRSGPLENYTPAVSDHNEEGLVSSGGHVEPCPSRHEARSRTLVSCHVRDCNPLLANLMTWTPTSHVTLIDEDVVSSSTAQLSPHGMSINSG